MFALKIGSVCVCVCVCLIVSVCVGGWLVSLYVCVYLVHMVSVKSHIFIILIIRK